jgi:hypothetical protein
MKELGIIIPMHEFGKENIELLNKAIESVPEGMPICLSTPKGTIPAKIKGASNRLNLVVSDEDGSSFAELVENGVNAFANNPDVKWFSILEFDDTYTPIWLDNAKKYIDFMPDTSVFMFLEDITDFNDGKYIGFGNEAAWASSFSNELGYIDLDCLQNYFDFYLTGSIFNLQDWLEVGGLKPSIKITFWYEWLLRATNKGKKVFVIPKVGYNHTLGRKNSLVEQYKAEISKEESDFWFTLAKREYFYKEDRNKEYDPEIPGTDEENREDTK